MRLQALHIQSFFSQLTRMGGLVFFCYLLCLPVSARAEILPFPLEQWESPAEPVVETIPEEPGTVSFYYPHLLRPSLGQGQTGTPVENSLQRKKKKKTSPNDTRNLAFVAWLATFCTSPSLVVADCAYPVVRDEVPYLPSWRGFAFYPLPPPLFS